MEPQSRFLRAGRSAFRLRDDVVLEANVALFGLVVSLFQDGDVEHVDVVLSGDVAIQTLPLADLRILPRTPLLLFRQDHISIQIDVLVVVNVLAERVVADGVVLRESILQLGSDRQRVLSGVVSRQHGARLLGFDFYHLEVFF
eukprot:CAMPEP_0170491948 /NCGR_PEP_ID=MMETSP0208-20121228/11399_1 /TAXON_ID=197538 /ORGANISM="Strombidium inclinatum, Strain S3" /LENGTH=142 /DNA_ID=CAMNT_0010767605 /DNA_START=125 /DNA_END=550 /DNA_ORIENTATION=+